jgi:CBS domain-containing protein
MTARRQDEATAGDLMIRDVAVANICDDVRNVARLLAASPAGAIPVLDAAREPIGIVTRSDLLPLAAEPPPPGWLVKRRPRPSALRLEARALREVMTAPAIFVPDATRLVEVLRLMELHHLKRMPVVDGRRFVGLLRRADVLRAIDAGATARSDAPPTARSFRELVERHEAEERLLLAERRRKEREAREALVADLAKRGLADRDWRDLLAQARRAASAGANEVVLIRFPSQLCTDGGRAINAPDPNWPLTLRGEAKDIFERWRNELQPRGFRLAAQIVEFPDGVPGDAALFLSWA